MEFYSDTVPWPFETCRYPTWDDCMRFYMSRIVNKVPQKTIINQLAEAVESIWKTGDGCPKAKSSIMKQFENHASNLKLLLQKTDLSLASTATMSDLERVLTGETPTYSYSKSH